MCGSWRRLGQWCAVLLAGVAVSGCVTITSEPRAVLLRPDGTVRAQRLACDEGSHAAQRKAPGAPALDPAAIRVLTWNIHKQDDPGWQNDLAAFAADNDVLLLQETVLEPRIREVVEGAGLRWVLASSFERDHDIGVMTASRIPPLAICTERATEPVLRLPKSAVIAWYALDGRTETLAVVTIHSINFSLSLGTYRSQLAAVRDVLATHRGPIIFAGDFNTWSDQRDEAVHETAAALGLAEIAFAEDHRKVFMGKHLDHIFIRGLATTRSTATRSPPPTTTPSAPSCRCRLPPRSPPPTTTPSAPSCRCSEPAGTQASRASR